MNDDQSLISKLHLGLHALGTLLLLIPLIALNDNSSYGFDRFWAVERFILMALLLPGLLYSLWVFTQMIRQRLRNRNLIVFGTFTAFSLLPLPLPLHEDARPFYFGWLLIMSWLSLSAWAFHKRPGFFQNTILGAFGFGVLFFGAMPPAAAVIGFSDYEDTVYVVEYYDMAQQKLAKRYKTHKYNTYGLSEAYYPNGLAKRLTYYGSDGKEDSTFVFHKNGCLDYVHRVWRKTENDREVTYFKEYKYDAFGSPMSMKHFRAGNWHGKFVTYNYTGMVKSCGRFETGSPVGEWHVYRLDDGSLLERIADASKRNTQEMVTWSLPTPRHSLTDDQQQYLINRVLPIPAGFEHMPDVNCP